MPIRLKFKRAVLIDGVWLLALAIYVLAGMTIAPFHGDEPMQIYMSHDYATAFIYKEPQRLMTSPPYDIDTDPQLRILNGSVNRYAIGLSWHLAGMNDGLLPPRPGWDWGLDYQTNVDTGHRPSDALMNAGRISSALFLVLSVAVMFGIGWQFGGRPTAYFASALYTLNPIILLNGRRAMMEGSMLFFGLLTILLAIIISRKREQRSGDLWGWWVGLILSGGLALASKHTGLIFTVSALGWIFVTELFRRRWRDFLVINVKLALSAILISGLFIALSPALWNDPPTRLQDLITTRSVLLDIQLGTSNPLTAAERIFFIFFQPFVAPLAHFELELWFHFDPITAEIQRYMASPLSGLQFGVILGIPLTLLYVVGIAVIFVPRLRGFSWGQTAGLLVWLLVTIAVMMVNPLPWQRYYIPLIPIATLFSTISVFGLLRLFGLQNKIPLVSPAVHTQTEERRSV
jgi:MFS family permease